MAALANKIGDHPVLLTLLRAPQSTAKEDRECGEVSLSAQTSNVYSPKKPLSLFCG